MQLVQIQMDTLSENPIEKISHGVIYYVHSGRNAWHSTWIKRYTPGCMHTKLNSAKEYAEKIRNRGTVIYIKPLPCLVFSCKDFHFLVTEINSKNPLSGYSPDAISDNISYHFIKMENTLNNYLKIGAPLHGAAFSFMTNSIFWQIKPSPKDSIIMLTSTNSNAVSVNDEAPLDLAYKSHSNGGKYKLGWSKIDSDVKNNAILKLISMVH